MWIFRTTVKYAESCPRERDFDINLFVRRLPPIKNWSYAEQFLAYRISCENEYLQWFLFLINQEVNYFSISNVPGSIFTKDRRFTAGRSIYAYSKIGVPYVWNGIYQSNPKLVRLIVCTTERRLSQWLFSLQGERQRICTHFLNFLPCGCFIS